jgi:hypothetical protein
MAKTKSSKLPDLSDLDLDRIMNLDEPEVWDLDDPRDQAFWEEFFKIEDLLSYTDELDPPTFSISVHNNQTGEVKTYSNIKLKSARKKIAC